MKQIKAIVLFEVELGVEDSVDMEDDEALCKALTKHLYNNNESMADNAWDNLTFTEDDKKGFLLSEKERNLLISLIGDYIEQGDDPGELGEFEDDEDRDTAIALQNHLGRN